MNDTWLGIVLTVIDGRAHQFSVMAQKPTDSTADPLDRIGREYIFDDARQSEPSERVWFVLRVTSKLASGWSDTNEQGLNDAAIRFGLRCIRSQPEQSKFLYTTEKHERMLALPRLEGSALRLAVLKLIHHVNELWPNELVSCVDLVDNLAADEHMLGEWLNILREEDLLTTESLSKNHKARGKGSHTAYRLSPKARERVAEEIGQKSGAGPVLPFPLDVENHRYFKLVETQIEAVGPFAFVLMPFREKEFPQTVFAKVYEPLVKEVLDISCVRVDSDKLRNFIESKIFSHIIKCELVIAELSTENPNVIFELGLALALGKRIIPTYHRGFAAADGKLAFDYDHFDTIKYDDFDQLAGELRVSLEALKGKVGTRT